MQNHPQVYSETNHEQIAEYNLWVNVLMRAIKDYVDPAEVKRDNVARLVQKKMEQFIPLSDQEKSIKAKASIEHRIEREARVWIFRRDNVHDMCIGSFEFVCAVLGLNPNDLRERITQLKSDGARINFK